MISMLEESTNSNITPSWSIPNKPKDQGRFGLRTEEGAHSIPIGISGT